MTLPGRELKFFRLILHSRSDFYILKLDRIAKLFSTILVLNRQALIPASILSSILPFAGKISCLTATTNWPRYPVTLLKSVSDDNLREGLGRYRSYHGRDARFRPNLAPIENILVYRPPLPTGCWKNLPIWNTPISVQNNSSELLSVTL